MWVIHEGHVIQNAPILQDCCVNDIICIWRSHAIIWPKLVCFLTCQHTNWYHAIVHDQVKARMRNYHLVLQAFYTRRPAFPDSLRGYLLKRHSFCKRFDLWLSAGMVNPCKSCFGSNKCCGFLAHGSIQLPRQKLTTRIESTCTHWCKSGMLLSFLDELLPASSYFILLIAVAANGMLLAFRQEVST